MSQIPPAAGSAAAVSRFLVGKLTADAQPSRIPVQSFPFTVGRRSDQSLSVSHSSISSRHAELLLFGDTLFVHDLGSTNGTFINGQRVSRLQPLEDGDLLQVAQIVLRLECSDMKQASRTMLNDSSDSALAILQFDRLLSERNVEPHFQPVVDLATLQVIGFEMLGRSRLMGLNMPGQMFEAASQLNLEAELSRVLRIEGLKRMSLLPGTPLVFFNTHPHELADLHTLAESLRELRRKAGNRALALEVHEGTVSDAATMLRLRRILEELDIKLAYDDFGTGQARLVEVMEVPPDYLKFDRQLIHNIHTTTAARQSSLERLVGMSRDLSIIPIAEGIETEEEATVCRQLGFVQAQGYFFGRPEMPANVQMGPSLPGA